MKAIVIREFGGPEVLRLETVADPTPGPGEVLVRIKAAGVNPVEAYRRAGTHSYRPPLPHTPGTDGAGIVEGLGRGATRRKVGERVYVNASSSGTYAELAACPEDSVLPLPERASFAQGACLGVPYGTAFRALFQRGRARRGESLLVHGASGGVGLAAVQFAKAAGLRIAGTAGTPAGRELVIKAGAERAFDHRDPAYLEGLAKWTEGRGVDVIVEMLANVNLAKDLTLLAPRGRVVVVGSRGATLIDPRELMTRDADVRGMTIRAATPEQRAEIDAAIGRGLADGTLSPVVGREYPLADAAESHRAVMEPGAHGKIVLLP